LSECHSIELLQEQGYLGKARVKGRSVRVPAGSLKFIPIVCPSSASITLPSVLLEPLEDGNCLPPGVLISKALLTVNRGIVEIPVVNVGLQNAWIRPNTRVGVLHVVHTKSPLCSVTLEDEDGSHVAMVQSVTADNSATLDLSLMPHGPTYCLSRSSKGRHY